MQNIVEFIKKEMEARGMTYELLASKSGMSKQNLWDKLNKRVRPNFGNAKKILAGMDYTLEVRKSENEDLGKRMEMFYEIAEEEQISYEAVESLLAALGYELIIKTQ